MVSWLGCPWACAKPASFCPGPQFSAATPVPSVCWEQSLSRVLGILAAPGRAARGPMGSSPSCGHAGRLPGMRDSCWSACPGRVPGAGWLSTSSSTNGWRRSLCSRTPAVPGGSITRLRLTSGVLGKGGNVDHTHIHRCVC